MQSLLTRTGTRKLSDVARHVVVPVGITSTGWPSVRDKCRDLGIVHDEWQAGAIRLALAKRADGKYAASVGGVVWSISRQIGKTFTVGSVIIALCLLFPGLTVLWTAHRTRTSTETFRAMKGLTGRAKVAPFMLEPRNTNGEQEIRFRNGSRVMFGARETGFGRGFAEVDIEVFDEAQILTDRALDDMIAATNQARHPAGALVFFIGTPPKPTDPGEAFTRMRTEALSGKSTDMAYIEISAEKGTSPDDLDRIPEYNPSYPLRTPLAAILRLRKMLSADSYRREGMGIWDEDVASAALPGSVWSALADPATERGTPVMFGLDVTEDRAAWIAVAWRRADGVAHVMLANDGQSMPAYRAVEECARLSSQWSGSVATSAVFVDELTAAGVATVKVTSVDFVAASGAFADAVSAGRLRHDDQPALNLAAKVTPWRAAGSDGSRAFQLKGCPEAGPLAAATRALHGLTVGAIPEPARPVGSAKAELARSETADLLTMKF